MTVSGPVGRPLARAEDARVLSGQSRFLDDIQPDRALHVAFVSSPYAHARIAAIESPSPVDGLAAVLTAADLSGHARSLPGLLSGPSSRDAKLHAVAFERAGRGFGHHDR